MAWEWGRLELHFAARTYNMFLIPMLGFTAQLVNPNREVDERISRVLRKAAPGPGNWATEEDLLHLEELHGES